MARMQERQHSTHDSVISVKSATGIKVRKKEYVIHSTVIEIYPTLVLANNRSH